MTSLGPRAALALSAAFLPTGCGGTEYREIDLGIDVRLDGVEWTDSYSDFVAVGAEGTVVHHYEVYVKKGGKYRPEDHVQVWKLGEADLRAVDSLPWSGPRLWAVVGDEGAIHLGYDVENYEDFTHTFTWYTQSGIEADLRGVAIFEVESTTMIIVVGNEFVATGVSTGVIGNYTWTETPPPPGGWGSLRHVSTVQVFTEDDIVDRVQIVGDHGRMWMSDLGPTGWVLVDPGIDSNLVDGELGRFCGARGNLVTCDQHEGCESARVGDFDFIACDRDWALDSDRRIYDLNSDSIVERDRLDWQPRAADGDARELVVVGDGGRVGIWNYSGPDR